MNNHCLFLIRVARGAWATPNNHQMERERGREGWGYTPPTHTHTHLGVSNQSVPEGGNSRAWGKPYHTAKGQNQIHVLRVMLWCGVQACSCVEETPHPWSISSAALSCVCPSLLMAPVSNSCFLFQPSHNFQFTFHAHHNQHHVFFMLSRLHEAMAHSAPPPWPDCCLSKSPSFSIRYPWQQDHEELSVNGHHWTPPTPHSSPFPYIPPSSATSDAFL